MLPLFEEACNTGWECQVRNEQTRNFFHCTCSLLLIYFDYVVLALSTMPYLLLFNFKKEEFKVKSVFIHQLSLPTPTSSVEFYFS